MLALAATGCGGSGDDAEAKTGSPVLQWYINPDDGGQSEIASRCTESAGGRYEQLLYMPDEAPERIRKQLEELGRELDAEWSRTQVVAKLNGETKLTEGEEVELAFDPHDVHVFDPATGTRLT
jgi:trehalose/maltose transport system substrate-binding protein